VRLVPTGTRKARAAKLVLQGSSPTLQGLQSVRGVLRVTTTELRDRLPVCLAQLDSFRTWWDRTDVNLVLQEPTEIKKEKTTVTSVQLVPSQSGREM
jgi:uncharacterized protein YlxP (DUF503 family)